MDALGFDAQLYDAIPEPWRHWLFAPAKKGAEGPTAAAFSPEFLDRFAQRVEPWYRSYFRCEVRGFEKVPPAPAFIVANHSGLGVVEVPLLLYAWTRRFGHDRPAHGLGHRLLFRVPLLRTVVSRVGAVPAGPEVGRRTLAAEQDLLVFPGGDWEAARPIGDRKRVDFGGRKGFVRLSLETGVPVTPLVICGAHETLLIFSRGERLAHALGLDERERLKTLPITPQFFFALWKTLQALRGKASPLLLPLWIANAWLCFPWLPSKITMEFLDPIDLRRELSGVKDAEEREEQGYKIVTSRMQEKLGALYAERRSYLG